MGNNNIKRLGRPRHRWKDTIKITLKEKVMMI
jgi:hypothetical protein